MTTFKSIAIFLLVIMAALKSSAQDTSKISHNIPRAYWVNLGLGVSSLGGLSGIVSANVQLSKTWVITAALQPETSESALDFSTHDETDLTTGDVLIGKVLKQQHGLFLFSAGISYGMVTYRHLTGLFSAAPRTSTNQFAYGVPILVQANLVMGQFAGVGLGLYTNINSQKAQQALLFACLLAICNPY